MSFSAVDDDVYPNLAKRKQMPLSQNIRSRLSILCFNVRLGLKSTDVNGANSNGAVIALMLSVHGLRSSHFYIFIWFERSEEPPSSSSSPSSNSCFRFIFEGGLLLLYARVNAPLVAGATLRFFAAIPPNSSS